MRKILPFLLSVLMILPLIACGAEKKPKQPERQEENDAADQSGYIQAVVEKDLDQNRIHVYSKKYPALDYLVLLPDSWTGKYDLEVYPGSISFYCSSFRKDNPFLGRLFTLSWNYGSSEPRGVNWGVPCKIIRDDETLFLIVTYPSDLQGMGEEYEAMENTVDQVQIIPGG